MMILVSGMKLFQLQRQVSECGDDCNEDISARLQQRIHGSMLMGDDSMALKTVAVGLGRLSMGDVTTALVLGAVWWQTRSELMTPEMLSRMRLLTSTKNWQEVDTSFAHLLTVDDLRMLSRAAE